MSNGTPNGAPHGAPTSGRHGITRRNFIEAAGMTAIGASLSFAQRSGRDPLLYIGTYTSGKSEGIYVYHMNPVTGELGHLHTVKGIVNPSYLAINPTRRFLYSVNEIGELAGEKTGGLTAFAIDRATGSLERLNQQPSRGTSPCYVTVHKSGKYLLAANYGSGTVSALPINNDGSLGAAVDVAEHKGAGANQRRQSGPHAHCIILDGSGKYAFAVDLGLDKVMIYRFDASTGKLTPNSQPFVQIKSGAGPRHIDLHPTEKFAYLINELDSTIMAMSYNKSAGMLKEIQTVSTLPAGFSETNYCADIHVHPGGKFVYGSNRGHDSIVAFRIDAGTGRLEYAGHQSTGGKTPRNFVIDPTGKFLLAANQNSNNIVVMRIDQQTGELKPAGHVTEVPTPVCLKFS